jgi:hypothetical protein
MTTTDRTTEPAGVFDAHLARWEAAEADPDGTVERVARAIYEAEEAGDWPEDERRAWVDVWPGAQGHYRRLAAAAIDALRPAPDAPRVESGAARELRAAIARVQAVYDLQCPAMPSDRYVGAGAHMAHVWWEKVLGGALDDLRDRLAALDAAS